MAQSTALAVGTSDATSSNIVIATSGTVGLFTSVGSLTNGVSAEILQVTPGNNISVGFLSKAAPSRTISSAGTYVVQRRLNACDGVSIGVFTDI